MLNTRPAGGQTLRCKGPAALIDAVASRYRLCAALCVALLLSGCSTQPLPRQTPTLALPMQLHVQREQADQLQDWLLVIQQEDGGLRWSLMDPLGIPLARQLLTHNRWHADGLLPPNPEARELFAALLFALTPAHELKRNYPQAKSVSNVRVISQRWQIQYDQPQVFRIDTQGDVYYDISPLNAEAAQ